MAGHQSGPERPPAGLPEHLVDHAEAVARLREHERDSPHRRSPASEIKRFRADNAVGRKLTRWNGRAKPPLLRLNSCGGTAD
jgi:hypothetical protein